MVSIRKYITISRFSPLSQISDSTLSRFVSLLNTKMIRKWWQELQEMSSRCARSHEESSYSSRSLLPHFSPDTIQEKQLWQSALLRFLHFSDWSTAPWWALFNPCSRQNSVLLLPQAANSWPSSWLLHAPIYFSQTMETLLTRYASYSRLWQDFWEIYSWHF